MGLIPGDRISLREAMYSMLLGSDNVAAATLADHAGRSIQSRSGGLSPEAALCDRDEQPRSWAWDAADSLC